MEEWGSEVSELGPYTTPKTNRLLQLGGNPSDIIEFPSVAFFFYIESKSKSHHYNPNTHGPLKSLGPTLQWLPVGPAWGCTITVNPSSSLALRAMFVHGQGHLGKVSGSLLHSPRCLRNFTPCDPI
ncbi:hypothetical protein CRG98_001394 [Punica granatum]|uniref:Uncharacterized protein n=1 Tax=Punica granatum TaxID=22663 RepID=A0A2I0LC17_PUNGR|nr:hypothetical protein CRG98_001394 [Punica granatum]